MSRSQVSIAKAKSLAKGFESAYLKAVEENVDITTLGWANFSDRMLDPIANPTLIHLARYALSDTLALITTIQRSLPADMPVECRRQLLHTHAELMYTPPASMTDDGKEEFLDHISRDNVEYRPGSATASVETLAWVGFDFDYYTSPHSGCPALSIDPADSFYAPGVGYQDFTPANSFLGQFFHMAIDVALNDPEIT